MRFFKASGAAGAFGVWRFVSPSAAGRAGTRHENTSLPYRHYKSRDFARVYGVQAGPLQEPGLGRTVDAGPWQWAGFGGAVSPRRRAGFGGGVKNSERIGQNGLLRVLIYGWHVCGWHDGPGICVNETDLRQLADWFEALGPALVLYARQWVGPSEAEDVVQDAFARLIVQPSRPANHKGWLYRSVRNAAIDRRRGYKRREAHQERLARQSPALEADPGDTLDAADVQRALASLDEDRREVVTLKVWGGLTLREMSHVTGKAISTLSHQYRSGLDEIRMKIGEPCRTNGTNMTKD
jgi:RNA polymerase sigma factor (sigma-70 family)